MLSLGQINTFNRIKTYAQTGAMAVLVSLGSCVQKAPTKDLVEFSRPGAAVLVKELEGGYKHAKTIFISQMPDVITSKEMSLYKEVPNSVLDTLKALPDTIETYYRVYAGKADRAIQNALKKKNPKSKRYKKTLVTAGHGTTGRDSIVLSDKQKAGLGDYISQFKVDSLLNESLIEKDSILRSSVKPSTYKKLKRYEHDAILSYIYNINDTLLKKYNPNREIPESFYQCLDMGLKAKVQAKFNVRPSSDAALRGLMKRNLVQMIIFGNGKIYNDIHAQKNFERALSCFKGRFDAGLRVSEILDAVRKYGVSEKNLKVTEEKMYEYLKLVPPQRFAKSK